MNYFAHGRPYLDAPYHLAGTAIPDWLSAVDRKVRARGKAAANLVDDADSRVALLARGIVQHHADDRWFHQTRAFAELSLHLTVRVRDLLGAEAGFRPSFVGHILVEILLDAALIQRAPGELDRYYAAMEEVEPELVDQVVRRVAGRSAEGLPRFIDGFRRWRFLYDYLEDDRLLSRLNGVMRRVGLPLLPECFTDLLAESRELIADNRQALLAGEQP